MWTKKFWKRTTERVVGTFAAVYVAAPAVTTNWDNLTSAATLKIALGAAGFTLVKSLAGSQIGAADDPAVLAK